MEMIRSPWSPLRLIYGLRRTSSLWRRPAIRLDSSCQTEQNEEFNQLERAVDTEESSSQTDPPEIPLPILLPLIQQETQESSAQTDLPEVPGQTISTQTLAPKMPLLTVMMQEKAALRTSPRMPSMPSLLAQNNSAQAAGPSFPSTSRAHPVGQTPTDKPTKVVRFTLSSNRLTLPVKTMTSVDNRGPIFRCDICQKNFARKGGLVKHMRVIHNPLRTQRIPRTKRTKKTPKTKPKKKSHTVLINRYFLRRRILPTRRGLTVTRKPLKSETTIHQSKSKERYRYPCCICDKTFAKRDSMIEHQFVFHKYLENPPTQGFFDCEICGKSFIRKFRYNSHMNTHTKPSICPFPGCDKRFSSNYSAVGHYGKMHEQNVPVLVVDNPESQNVQ